MRHLSIIVSGLSATGKTTVAHYISDCLKNANSNFNVNNKADTDYVRARNGDISKLPQINIDIEEKQLASSSNNNIHLEYICHIREVIYYRSYNEIYIKASTNNTNVLRHYGIFHKGEIIEFNNYILVTGNNFILPDIHNPVSVDYDDINAYITTYFDLKIISSI